MEVFIVVILALFLYLLIKPKSLRKEPKSKEQKQQEIISMYEQKLKEGLRDVSKDDYIKTKTALLTKISKELHNNLFFDEDEVKQIIQELAK
ncbi:hypothetical protein ACKGJI_07875 [Sulfurospirillum sp. 1307]